MSNYIRKNINKIIGIFLILQPILDIFTGICVNTLKVNITIGIIIRILFLIFICFTTLFIFKKKKLFIPYTIVGIYFILYLIGMITFKDSSLLAEIKSLIRTFYFPLMFMSLFSIKDEIRISNMTLLTVLFLYLIFLFVPTLFGLGYKAYEITKVGTLGFYNSANELSGIISILTPIMLIIFVNSKKLIPIITLSFMYLVVILMIGTKTPLLSLIITIFIAIIYLLIHLIKIKKYKQVIISLSIVLIGLLALIIVMPKTNFYKNIRTHLDYLELDHITDVFKDEKYIDHFIFSSRLQFLKNKARIYSNSSNYEKLFGIGYINNDKETKLIEMDYFDIYYSHGIVGFLIFYIIIITILYKVLVNCETKSFNNIMKLVSVFLIIFLSFFTGHIMTAPSVSLISCIIIVSLYPREKKDLAFYAVNLDLGGIETALINLVNRVDYNKYNVSIILEEKKGIFLDTLNKEIEVREVKVSNNHNILLRKITNVLRKLIYKIFNYKNYDFSCCYATYSYSSSKLALTSSNNTSIYVHSDYRTVYKDEKEFRNFFDTRNINEYKNIIFVSKENKKGFIEIYKDLKNKCHVYNNFINIDNILSQSNEKIDVKKQKDKILLVFVGRLDDKSKKISRQINLVREINNLELWIIGDGPDRKMYEKEVKESKLEKRVTFFGRQKNPYKYMIKADYIILTSDYEGFPVTYLEALALNKDIITTYEASDDKIDIKKYAHIISKDNKKMIKEVKEIINNKNNRESVDLEKCQKERMKDLEKMFNEVV